MGSAGLGLVAAVSWGLNTLALARGAKEIDSRVVAALFLLFQGAILVIPAALAGPEWDLRGFSLAGLAAFTEVAGVQFLTRALREGDVSVVAPLVSLEGAFAAACAIAAGETLTPPLVVGLIAASAGGAMVSATTQLRLRSRATADALGAAAMFGLGLWLIAEAELNLALTMLIFNGVAGLVIWATPQTPPLAEALRQSVQSSAYVVLAAVGSLVGFAAFITGARGDYFAVTAIIAAQFAVIAVVGGYLFFGERLSRHQALGIVVLLVGVGVVAAESGA